ncbi:MAG: putative baseplate assembly protein [Isosphaerales bacterium]
MKQPCGCCTGIEVVTPQPEANRPGLSALSYRVGTYATFFESMVARLSSIYLDVPTSDASGALERIRPLDELTTRELSDPSIALLDAWAIVADVLTFYEERIANEGYLATATERRSILELGRLVGYKPRPGVSASVYLAFTVATGFNGTIPAGTRAQSIPGTGETAQFFESSVDLTARDTWNNLQPRLTRPQVITLNVDPGTDALTRDTLYFQGISTNLKTGDAILIVLGDDPGQQVPRFVNNVEAQADQNRTEVTLQITVPQQPGRTPGDTVSKALAPFIDQATSIFADSDLASTVSAILTELVNNVNAAPDGPTAGNMVRAAVPQIEQEHDIARKRKFTRLEPWTADLLSVLKALASILPGSDTGKGGEGQPQLVTSPLEASALGNLTAIIDPLALPPSLQPANPKRLVRTIAQMFSPQADTAPRLLAAFRPAVATTIYQAWAGVETPSSQVQVYALRVKAAPYGNNAPKQASVITGEVPCYHEWPLASVDAGSALSLDSTYDKIVPGSWVVIGNAGASQPLITQVNDVKSVSRSDYGMAARVTELILGQPWLTVSGAKPDISTLRQVTVWAQPDPLDLAEEPLDTDVEGDTIELAQLYDGLESGRWIIVSGERTDIPNTTGVTASEVVMISAVTQGSHAPLCATLPPNLVPPFFSRVYYITDASTQGDRLVVGELVGDAQGVGQLKQQLPPVTLPNQQFCDQVQLAPGLYVNAYVPTSDELAGNFPDFEGLLVDPTTNLPYLGGVIPAGVLGQVFAWRISTAPVHTILTLANSLAYTYDSTSITIYGNVANATHGQTVGEILGDGDGSQAFQSFALHQKPLTYVPATNPQGVQSTLVVRVNEVEWDEADDLASLEPTDHEYITQTDDSDHTTVIFGNGEHGARVPTGSANIKAVYRYGIGAAGNVQAGQISQLASHPQGAQGVINPLPASGGADRDSIVQARSNTPVAVMALDRLVSVQDYADFSRNFAGIGKSSAARLTDGRRLVVHVTIAGALDVPIDPTSNLYQNLIQALLQFGDPYLPIQVALRKLKLLVISARIEILPDYQWESVEPDVRDALLGAFGFDQRNLGQSAFLSEAISIIQQVDGVSYVDVQTFDAVPEDSTTAQLAGLAGSLALNSFVQANLARVDPAATDPANRMLPAELVILTPDIPDTLILTEVTA